MLSEEAATDADPARSAPAVDDPGDASAFVLGGRLRPTWSGAAIITALLAIVALPLRGLYAATGSSMEEGFMLVFPHLVWQGKVPNVDFLHLYGPGSLYLLAPWYEVFGYTLEAERTFGLLQHVALIFGVYALGRAWGRITAAACATATLLLVLTPIGLSALAWEGGLALAVWAVVAALRATHSDGPQATRAWVASGVLAGLALCFRPDLVVGVALGMVWLVWRKRAWRPALAGFGIGVLLLLVQVVRAGVGPSVRGMLIDPVLHLRPGRELPRPPSWGRIDGALQAVAEGVPPWWRFPAMSANHQLFVWFWLVLAFAVAVPLAAFLLWRRLGPSRPRTVLLAGGLLGLGILPQAWQRPDSTHLAWVACISWGLLPALVVELVRARRPVRRTWVVGAVGGLVVAGLFFVVCPFYTYRHYLLHSRVSVGNLPKPFEVERDGRHFWFGDYFVQQGSLEAIAALQQQAKPGERLLVGPADLSRTIYSDVAFYYLFPELKPATYFIEMDPGLADKAGSRLAADVASADWVLLTNFWTGWYEPNASSHYGSEAPNQVVADQFCLVGSYQDSLVLLFHKCAKGDGINPAEVGDRPPPEGGARP